jgi:peptide/nickel transport system substrate-binding protein
MKTRLTVALVVAGAACAGLGSSSDAAPRTTGAVIPLLRIGDTESVPTLDVARREELDTVFSLETLVKIGPDGRVHPNLATSVTQPGPATYVYHLRKGVKFWDGNELTADDVANALNYNRFPGSQVAFFYSSVKSIKAQGRYTVVVTLKHRDASWQFSPASYGAGIFEKRFQLAHKSTYGLPGTLVMGTGPWKVDSFDPTTGLSLSANPSWWGGKVPVQHLTIKLFADESSEALAFRAGEIDVVGGLGVGDPRAFASTSGAKIVSVPSCRNGWVAMDTQEAPWNDVHVRRAVAYAINKQDIISATGEPNIPVATLIAPDSLRSVATPSQIRKLLASLPQYPYSIAKAKQELAKSAYPHGFTATINAPPAPPWNLAAQAVAGDLQKAGINLQVKAVTFDQWIAGFTGARGQLGINFVSSQCLTPDPSFMPGELLGTKNNRPGSFNIADYAPADLDTLIKAGVTTVDPAKRFAIYSKLLQRLALDMPYVPVWLESINLALSSRFTWPSFDAYSFQGGQPWPLGIKAR